MAFPWAQTAGLGLSILGGFSSGKAAENAQRVQAANQYQQTLIGAEREYLQIQQAMRNQGRQNTAIAKADIQSLINTNFTMGLLNLQRAMQKQQTAAGIQRLGQTRLQALAQSTVSAAATGTVGASMDAVAADIEMKVGEANIALREQNEMNTLNMSTQIHNLYQGFMDSQVEIDVSVPDIPGMPPKFGVAPVSAGAMALGAGINYMGQHLSSMFSFGSGFDIGSGFNMGGLGSMSDFTSSLNVKF